MAAELRRVQSHNVEVVGDWVYVNFDHRAAVVVAHEDGWWTANVTEWDATGGVHADREIVTHSVPDVIVGHVAKFLAEEERRNAELLAHLEKSSE